MIDRKILAGLVLACCAVPAGAKEPFPQALHVDVVFVEEGPEGVREQLERALLLALDRSRCFPRVERFSHGMLNADEALLLRVAVEQLIDETSFDLSIAERYSPNALPDARRQVTNWLEVRYQLELHVLPGSIPLRTKIHNIRTGYRPRLDEDPREENRVQAIDQVVRTTKAFACKGSPKKLRKEIDRARSASSSEGAAPR